MLPNRFAPDVDETFAKGFDDDVAGAGVGA